MFWAQLGVLGPVANFLNQLRNLGSSCEVLGPIEVCS